MCNEIKAFEPLLYFKFRINEVENKLKEPLFLRIRITSRTDESCALVKTFNINALVVKIKYEQQLKHPDTFWFLATHRSKRNHVLVV